PAGAAATKPPAAVAITATIPASRRRCELVCMVLLLCECWCCYYAGTAQLVRAAGKASFERRSTRSRTARAPRAEEELGWSQAIGTRSPRRSISTTSCLAIVFSPDRARGLTEPAKGPVADREAPVAAIPRPRPPHGPSR